MVFSVALFYLQISINVFLLLLFCEHWDFFVFSYLTKLTCCNLFPLFVQTCVCRASRIAYDNGISVCKCWHGFWLSHCKWKISFYIGFVILSWLLGLFIALVLEYKHITLLVLICRQSTILLILPQNPITCLLVRYQCQLFSEVLMVLQLELVPSILRYVCQLKWDLLCFLVWLLEFL